jgi:hypothetical protein
MTIQMKEIYEFVQSQNLNKTNKESGKIESPKKPENEDTIPVEPELETGATFKQPTKPLLNPECQSVQDMMTESIKETEEREKQGLGIDE